MPTLYLSLYPIGSSLYFLSLFYTLSGVAYIFKAYFIPYRDENRYLKSIFATHSDVNFSNFSFFCINKERKVQETIQAPLKNQEPLKIKLKNHLKKIKNP